MTHTGIQALLELNIIIPHDPSMPLTSIPKDIRIQSLCGIHRIGSLTDLIRFLRNLVQLALCQHRQISLLPHLVLQKHK